MKKIIAAFAIAFMLFSCSSVSEKELAISYKESLKEVSLINNPTYQLFVDSATVVALKLTANHKAHIDFRNLSLMLNIAHSNIKRAIDKLKKVKEFDDEIALKSKYESLLNSEQQVLLEYDNYIEVLKNNQSEGNIEELNASLVERLTDMKTKQKVYKKVQILFNNKYQLD